MVGLDAWAGRIRGSAPLKAPLKVFLFGSGKCGPEFFYASFKRPGGWTTETLGWQQRGRLKPAKARPTRGPLASGDKLEGGRTYFKNFRPGSLAALDFFYSNLWGQPNARVR